MVARERSLSWILALTFILGGLLGGGPVSPKISMMIELLGCFLAAIALAGMVDGHFSRRAWPALILIAWICIAPLLQLIPLPASLWRDLPGHDVPAAISRLAGLGSVSRPISLTPEQTSLAVLTLIVPVAVFMASLQLGTYGRDLFILVVVLSGILSSILGVFQVAAGGGIDLGIYRQTHDGSAIGFFANKNHEADLLLIAMVFSAHLIRLQRWTPQAQRMAMVCSIAFFALSVFSTQSRTAFTLVPIALAGTWMVWIGDIRDRRVWIGLGLLVPASLLVYAFLHLTPLGTLMLNRFASTSGDLRFTIWQDTWQGIKQFWPYGSGTGSFVPVHEMSESLASLYGPWVNHAHNEYLEILLENGLLGAILLLVYLAIFLSGMSGPLPHPLRGQRYAMVCAIILLLAHSATDYPLRTFGLMTIFAFANALLYPPRGAHRVRRKGSYPVEPVPAFAVPGKPD